MSDPFDPEAWPRSSGASSPRKDDDNVTNEDDDFNPFTSDTQADDYDSSTFGNVPNYGDDDNDPYGTYDAGTANYGQADDDDDDDDDPWKSVGSTYGDDDDDADPWATPAAVSNSYGDTDDDDDFSYESSSTGGAAAGFKDEDDYRDEFDDYDDDFRNYDDDNFDDDNYDDSEYDDTETESGGNARRIVAIVGAIAIAGLLGGGLLFLFGNGDDKKPVAQPTTTQPQQTTQTSAPANTGTSAPANTGTSAPTGGTAATAPKDVTDTLNNALNAWGKFAVDGDINSVKPYFVEDSSQYDRFKLDAAAIASQPPGGAPITVKMNSPETFQGSDTNSWLIRGNVTWSRSGEATQNFPWEIRMVRTSDRQPWQIASVRQY